MPVCWNGSVFCIHRKIILYLKEKNSFSANNLRKLEFFKFDLFVFDDDNISLGGLFERNGNGFFR